MICDKCGHDDQTENEEEDVSWVETLTSRMAFRRRVMEDIEKYICRMRCENCGKVFYTPDSLYGHINECHKEAGIHALNIKRHHDKKKENDNQN